MADKDKIALHHIYLAAAVAEGILLAILIAVTPAAADDLFFMIPVREMGSESDAWQKMIREVSWVWETQSGRLGNFLSLPFLFLLPRWVFGIITGALFSFILLEMTSLVGTRRGSVVSWLIMAVMVFAYPWYDYLTQVTYAVNYVWASAILVGALWCFLNSGSLSKPLFVVALIWTFVSGWIHEGFGVPYCCGLTLWMLINRRRLDSRKILLWLMAASGSVMTAFSPTFWSRSQDGAGNVLDFPLNEAVIQLGPALLVCIVFVVSLGFCTIRKKTRQRLVMYGLLWIVIGGVICSMAVFLRFYSGPRTGAPLLLFSSLGCALMFRILGEPFNSRPAAWIIGVMIALCAFVNLVFAIVRQTDLNKESQKIESLYNASPDGAIYLDLIYPVADASLYKTTVRQFHERVPIFFWEKYHDSDKHLVILPAAIRDFIPERAQPSGKAPGIWVYKNHIIASQSLDLSDVNLIRLLTGEGSWTSSRFRADPFTGRDGHRYVLITPHLQTLDHSVRIIDCEIYSHQDRP